MIRRERTPKIDHEDYDKRHSEALMLLKLRIKNPLIFGKECKIALDLCPTIKEHYKVKKHCM